MANVIVGMSGGVDSSVAAYLLKQQGYEVEGVSLVLYEARNKTAASLCCSIEARESAAETAAALGIKHRAIDVRGAFIDEVVDPFVEAYRNGRTPNPCILCNRRIKFPCLLRAADDVGAEFIATGHYARVERGQGAGGGGQRAMALLKRGRDHGKDQSYVLYGLRREELERLILPLGEVTKDEVRQIARSLGLPAADRPESQEICFVENNDYAAFISALDPDAAQPGPIINSDGRRVGTHKGVYFYTIGQRKGLHIPSLHSHFVTRIDPECNTIYVGAREDALSAFITVEDLNWLIMPDMSEFRASVKVRSMMEARPAIIEIRGETALVTFDEPQWAPAPGQAAVFYNGDDVVGGGVISLRPGSKCARLR